ncbi:hypothetical protein ATL39_2518 [Sinobaca qinghaiensis]|uniref:Uncharacterized protein n=1 Tax=Sinobaca qinghaiensis TaxID=342944 RepID=A0A419UZK7_9BACL|nr:hypothetical protein [Sinobaca qinghaiensis]RKD71127.1 hypothetical protein ATL39_2518 [Sinobaca qinghaiensis]
MLITIEDELIYIYLQHKANKTTPLGAYPEVSGYMLYDRKGNWLGYRVMRTIYNNENYVISIPKVRKIEYPLFTASIEDAEEYIEIKFHADLEAAEMLEQACLLDINEDGLFGVELIRHPDIPAGETEHVRYFLEK